MAFTAGLAGVFAAGALAAGLLEAAAAGLLVALTDGEGLVDGEALAEADGATDGTAFVPGVDAGVDDGVGAVLTTGTGVPLGAASLEAGSPGARTPSDGTPLP